MWKGIKEDFKKYIFNIYVLILISYCIIHSRIIIFRNINKKNKVGNILPSWHNPGIFIKIQVIIHISIKVIENNDNYKIVFFWFFKNNYEIFKTIKKIILSIQQNN